MKPALFQINPEAQSPPMSGSTKVKQKNLNNMNILEWPNQSLYINQSEML